jgi:hypothetical protein
MILLALNELNINLIKGYINDGKLRNFQNLFKNGIVSTKSETDYSLLEPWIQWVTVHSGLSFKEHGIFRLGDIVGNINVPQFFEELEKQGLTVGAISPFNVENRLLNPSFFVPDPWTQTKASGSYLLRKLSFALSNLVNSNASGKFKVQYLLWLVIGFLAYVPVTRWMKIYNIVREIQKPGGKAILLDKLLAEVFLSNKRKMKPDFSYLFLNGGAHIQHHYFFNSKSYTGSNENPDWYCPKGWDPVFEILQVYDDILGDLNATGEKLLCLTALQQVPHEENTYYWRPLNHNEFLIECGLRAPFKVLPRMSRDFLVTGDNEADVIEFEKILSSFVDSQSGKSVFAVDNRGLSLFVEIIFNDEIGLNLTFKNSVGVEIGNLISKLVFVAIKNGKHDGTGFIFSNFSLKNLQDTILLTEVRSFIEHTALNDFRGNTMGFKI